MPGAELAGEADEGLSTGVVTEGNQGLGCIDKNVINSLDAAAGAIRAKIFLEFFDGERHDQITKFSKLMKLGERRRAVSGGPDNSLSGFLPPWRDEQEVARNVRLQCYA